MLPGRSLSRDIRMARVPILMLEELPPRPASLATGCDVGGGGKFRTGNPSFKSEPDSHFWPLGSVLLLFPSGWPRWDGDEWSPFVFRREAERVPMGITFWGMDVVVAELLGGRGGGEEIFGSSIFEPRLRVAWGVYIRRQRKDRLIIQETLIKFIMGRTIVFRSLKNWFSIFVIRIRCY